MDYVHIEIKNIKIYITSKLLTLLGPEFLETSNITVQYKNLYKILHRIFQNTQKWYAKSREIFDDIIKSSINQKSFNKKKRPSGKVILPFSTGRSLRDWHGAQKNIINTKICLDWKSWTSHRLKKTNDVMLWK